MVDFDADKGMALRECQRINCSIRSEQPVTRSVSEFFYRAPKTERFLNYLLVITLL